MYTTSRAANLRNLSIALVNGTITLIVLLIAPLGLAAVIANTFLVTAATFLTATTADQITRYLQPSRTQAIANPLDSGARSSQIVEGDSQNLQQK
ncbi:MULTISPECIES: CRISPR-associated protein Csx18 [unclassified Microcoleus]|uniref:CRISPR-associated protein Csx18 n=1 Tax=unclassified Microcoleus TaxID=2642155 RepID=UPI002FD680FF